MARLVWVQAWKAHEAVTVKARRIQSRSDLLVAGSRASIGAMPALIRRRYAERPNCWHVYYGDVR
jgi:hypothetical protein